MKHQILISKSLKMMKEKSNSIINFQNGNSLNEKTTTFNLQSPQLMQLFENHLKDIFWAEKALIKAIPKMIQKAESVELIIALSNHLEETYIQLGRLAKVFASVKIRPVAIRCNAIDGLIKEVKEIIESTEEGFIRDNRIILAAQKIEQYEIATYGTLSHLAKKLGLTEAIGLLEASLEEEKAIDEELLELSNYVVYKEISLMES